jgi:phosphotransferase system enzyme I (PtsI)
MLRASAYGPVRILLPMLTDASEVRAAQSLIESCRAELRAQRIGQGELVQVGGMIETPAAALRARDLLHELDFVSIGSNDLTQYTLAADRNHAGLAHVYEPLHPAVLQLIAQTVDAAQRARKPCVLCGELAGDTRALPALLALGLTQLSVHPDALLEVRETLLLHSRKRLRARRAKLLAARDADEIAEALQE